MDENVRWTCPGCEVAWTSGVTAGGTCWSCGGPGRPAEAPSMGKDGLYLPSRPAVGTWGLLTGQFGA